MTHDMTESERVQCRKLINESRDRVGGMEVPGERSTREHEDSEAEEI